MTSSPRPGTLEWLTDQRPDEAVLLTSVGALTRSAWEARAEAVAEGLAADGVAAGDLLSAAGRIGVDWFVTSWAAAKLGAGLAGLPPGPVLELPGARFVELDHGDLRFPAPGADPAAPEGGAERPAPRRLSGTAPPPDAVTFSRLGRAVRRRFTAATVPAIGTTLADLVARLRAVPGTTLVVCGPVSDPILTFLASVVLVGGGRVASAPTPAATLALAAPHDAGLAALAPADLAALAELDAPARETLDLTSVGALVTGGAPVAAADRAAADDLFGPETIIDVYATADTGVVAVRSGDEPHHVLLEGVSVRLGAAGLLEVRSPLAAAPGWVATGDRAGLVGDGGMRLPAATA